MRVLIIVLALLPAALNAAPAKVLAADQREAVETYIRNTELLKSSTPGVSIEQVFADAMRIHDVLVGHRADGFSIEDISAEEFASLRERLPGITLSRDEVILAEPDSEYFLKLATRYGNAADREFFKVFRVTYPDGVWPAYIEQMTDFQGCSDFGSGAFVRTYQGWTDFKRSHPGRYRDEVNRRLEHIEESIADNCGCGKDTAAVLAELRDFAKRFPKSPARNSVVHRIRDLESTTPEFRLQCSL